MQITGFQPVPGGGYAPMDGGAISDAIVFAVGQGSSATTYNIFGLELYYPGNTFPAAPRSITLASTTYNNCTDCVLLDLDCDSMGNNCTKSFLAQMGSLNISAQRIVQAGQDGGIAGTGSSLKLTEWDFMNDVAVNNGACAEIPSVMFNGTW
jgi:hypothetical protein